MKSRAYRPSHDRIIIPNTSSEHFKGHFIPVPTPHNTSQQSRWPDLNQVPLAGLWCPTPSDQQDICRANSIRFTLTVSQKCMDLSLSDMMAHLFAAARVRMSHVDTEESKRHSGGTQDVCTLRNKRAAVTLWHFPEVFGFFFFFYLSARMWLSKQKRQMEIDGNIYEVTEMATSCGTNKSASHFCTLEMTAGAQPLSLRPSQFQGMS